MSAKRSGKDIALGALIGGVLGAAAALLLAPKSGRELREDISEQYAAITDKTKQLAQTACSQTAEWVGKAREAGGQVANEVKTRRGKREDTSVETLDSVPIEEDDRLIAQPI